MKCGLLHEMMSVAKDVTKLLLLGAWQLFQLILWFIPTPRLNPSLCSYKSFQLPEKALI